MRTCPVVELYLPGHELLRLARKKLVAPRRPVHLVQLAPHADPVPFDRDEPRELIADRVKTIRAGRFFALRQNASPGRECGP